MTLQKTPFDGHISYMLAAAHRAVSKDLSDRLKKHGVQIEAWRIMECLDVTDRLTMGELATRVLMNPPTLSKMVDRMVSDGLVHRQIAQRDNRQVNLLLTDLGRTRMLRVRAEVEAHNQDLTDPIDGADNQILLDLLVRLSREHS